MPPPDVDSRAGRSGPAAAFTSGWRRVIRAPAIAFGVPAALILLALPLAVVLGQDGSAQAVEATDAGEAWQPGWAIECGAEALAGGQTLPLDLALLVGVGPGSTAPPGGGASIAVAGAALLLYLGFWILTTGGILDRLARDRPVHAHGFFAACGAFAFRLFRLAVVAGAAYAALFVLVDPEEAGPTGLAVWLTTATLIGAVVDFARVRLVVEDRRSVIGSVVASLRFARRRLWRVAGLYLMNGAALAVVVIVGTWFTSSAGSSAGSASSALGLIAFVGLRTIARIAFLASEIAFFQGELAHAGFTAAPARAWPESASEEAIRNLAGRD